MTFHIEFLLPDKKKRHQKSVTLLICLVLLLVVWQDLENQMQALIQMQAIMLEKVRSRSLDGVLSKKMRRDAEAKSKNQRALSYDWKSVLDSLEVLPSDQLRVEAFDHDQKTGKSRIEISAAHYSDVEQALARLDDLHSSTWKLRSVETSRDAPGEPVIKADLIGYFTAD